jgi:hypothetical protein
MSGGGMLIASCEDVRVEGSSILGNRVVVGSGSGIHMSDSLDLLIVDNLFRGNEAVKGSGSVYWIYSSLMSKGPDGLQDLNQFADNLALFSPDVSTTAVRFLLFLSSTPANSVASVASGATVTTTASAVDLFPDDRSVAMSQLLPLSSSTSSVSTVIVNEYTSALPPLELLVLDFYGQVQEGESGIVVKASLTTGQGSSSTSSNFNTCLGRLTGQTDLQVAKGRKLVNEMKGICKPSQQFAVRYSTELSGFVQSTNVTFVFRECMAGEYDSETECLECPEGSYSLKFVSGKGCKKCPLEEAVSCRGNVISLKSGYWRISNATDEIFACPLGPVSCLGGSQTNTESCGVGYSGPLCSLCSEGYFLQSITGECQVCPTAMVTPSALVLLVIIVLVAVLTFRLLFVQDFDSVDQLTDFTVFGFLSYLYRLICGDDLGISEEDLGTVTSRVTGKTKIYVSLVQIVAAIPSVMDVSMPLRFSEFISIGAIVNLDFFSSAGVACTKSYDFIDYLLVMTLAPPAILLLLYVLYLLQTSTCCHRGEADAIKKQRQHKLVSSYLTVALMFLSFVLPGICIYIFQTFVCVDLDSHDLVSGSQKYLSSDYSISCASDRYLWGYSYAIAMVFVYPVGVPLFYFYLMYRKRHILLHRNDPPPVEISEEDLSSIEPLAFLFDDYAPEFWYWEIIETFRKVSLTGALVLVSRGTGFQIVVALVTTQLFIKLYGYYGECLLLFLFLFLFLSSFLISLVLLCVYLSVCLSVSLSCHSSLRR